jgi:hypothetical protein
LPWPRPGGGHLEAVRGLDRVVAVSVGGRRLADDGPERAAEGSEAGEPDIEADVSDTSVGLAQQKHRSLDSSPLEVAMRRLAEAGPETADEMGLRQAGHRRNRANVERLGVGAVHGVAGAQQAAIQLLDSPAHASMVGDRNATVAVLRSRATDSAVVPIPRFTLASAAKTLV